MAAFGNGFESNDDLFADARRFDKKPMDVTFYVRRNETVELYSQWSGIPVEAIREKSSLAVGDNLRVGVGVTIPLDAEKLDRFETSRERFHSRYEEEFYGQYAEAGFKDYTIKRGDFPYRLQQMAGPGIVAPLWLLEKHNPDVDFSLLQIGTSVRVPQLVKATRAGGGAAAADGRDVAPPVQVEKSGPVAPSAGTITVKSGDTPSVLAARHGVSVQGFMDANPGLEPRRMQVGQQVRIPGMGAERTRAVPAVASSQGGAGVGSADYEANRGDMGAASGRFTTHVVKSGENGWVIAVKRHRITTQALQDANPEVRIDALQPGMVLRIPQGR